VVSALNLSGESANSTPTPVTTLQAVIPSAPASLIATAGNNSVALSWQADPAATSYNVKRATVSGGPYTTLASVSTTNYVDTTATQDTTYYYVVSAVNFLGESANSSEVSARFHGVLILTGTTIGTPGSWNNGPNTIANVFDNNLTTYYDAVNGTGDWAGLFNLYYWVDRRSGIGCTFLTSSPCDTPCEMFNV